MSRTETRQQQTSQAKITFNDYQQLLLTFTAINAGRGWK